MTCSLFVTSPTWSLFCTMADSWHSDRPIKCSLIRALLRPISEQVEATLQDHLPLASEPPIPNAVLRRLVL